MRAKRRSAKEAATTSRIGTSYTVDGKTLTMRVSAEEGEHAVRWLAQKGRPTWTELLRAAHAHAGKALGHEPYASAIREVAMVMMREPAAMKRLAMLVKAAPTKAKKRVEANA